MKKVLIAALSVFALSCAHVHAQTAPAKKKPATQYKTTSSASKAKATSASKNVAAQKTSRTQTAAKPKAQQTARKQNAPKQAAAKKNTVKQASAPRDRLVGADVPMSASSPGLHSSAVLVQDQATGSIIYEKNASAVLPIASITKLMTAMVTLDAHPDLQEVLTISEADIDTLKGTRSRLKIGTQLTREEMLRLALMSSENRASSALGRYYPGGRPAFIAAMNRKAYALGLKDTHFEDSTGLTSNNVSSARDLVQMVSAAHQYPLIREFSTSTSYEVIVDGRIQSFHNTNSLVNNASWDIGLSKTGFINEAGKCLVMQTWVNQKPMIIVLLDSWGKMTRIGDANRIKKWVEHYAQSNKANTI